MSSSNSPEVPAAATTLDSVVDEEFEDDSEEEYEEDAEEEYEEAEDDEGEASESGSVSTFSESELDRPTRPFDPMPEHLTLPLELQRLVLSFEGSQYEVSWGTYRFVCKAWKEYIERRARTRWIRTGAFSYAGYMIRDEEENKVFLSGDFTFKSMDGETAIFRDDECAEKYRKALVKACKATSPPDVEICGYFHDVKIPGMSVDWDTLTITCPWRTLVGRVIAEELRVAAYRRIQFKDMMQKVKSMRNSGVDSGIGAVFQMLGNHFTDAYSAVRRERLGYADRKGDERLKDRRFMASFREDDDGEEE